MFQYICDHCGLPIDDGMTFTTFLKTQSVHAKKEITIKIELYTKGIHLHKHCLRDMANKALDHENSQNDSNQ